MVSEKSYRFIMEPVFGKGVGDISGPFHTDGRHIAEEEKLVELVGGPDRAIFVGEVGKGKFKIVKKYAQLPSIIVYTECLVVHPEVARVLHSFKLGEEIGSLPVALTEDGKPIADYVWFYATKVYRPPCDLPESDLALLGNITWMITDELREEIVKQGFTGVRFEQIGK